MDWSTVFADHGEEDGSWDSHMCRLDPILEKLALTGKYGPAVAYALTVNYILGVGCLGVPFAFLKSGLILGSVMVVFITIVTLITVLWVAEACYRLIQIKLHDTKGARKSLSARYIQINSQVATRQIDNDNNLSQPNYMSIQINPKLGKENNSSHHKSTYPSLTYASMIQTTPLLPRNESLASEPDAQSPQNHHVHEETEVASLVKEFMGGSFYTLYQISLTTITFTALLAYSQVFNNAFIQQLYPNSPLILPNVIFGLIVVPLSCTELSEQVYIQVIMSIMRFVSLGILFIGSFIALFILPSEASSSSSSPPTNQDSFTYKPSSPPYFANNIPFVDFTGFSIIFTTAIFSQLFQHSVPGLIRPLSLGHKPKVPYIFFGALLTTASLYIIIGITSVVYFGEQTNQSINLNFVNFTWGMTKTRNQPLYYLLYFCSMIVVLFPALDTISVFPLIANTLGNNLQVFFPILYRYVRKSQLRKWFKDRSSKHVTLIIWRLVASIPPIILSNVVTDLSISLQIAGICGIIIALIVPAFLQRYSLHKFNSYQFDISVQKNPYMTLFSQPFFTVIVIIVGLAALFVCTYQLFEGFLGRN